ncbi:hypothetical protein [Paralcaligenes ureilyticus]|uniref:Apea-like HEPN domain-containing protein n=1 Tax=Paralcaligenes ureilyticus TaxID=627131 RepID=A0A4R3MB26_9BURK|nr:hypothetical protein [Paralcaligenes ureilyticus]TCT10824.1 hypothetical protein EDC26_10143 [Paralcaligenes ureilyticus]
MTHHPDLDLLAGKLFQVFSRTEYALKAAGYNKGNGPAQANWREFALAVEDLIASPATKELQEAIEFLFTEPPKKQMIVNERIQWVASEPETSSRADCLLTYVRRVRNNLFHGGKFNGHWFAPVRSKALLHHSLTILTACVGSVPKVREAYYG